MTNKPLSDLDLGDYICDMHYGTKQLTARFEVVSHVQWDEPHGAREAPDYEVPHAFYDYLQQFTPRLGGYTNKNLIVIGWGNDSTLSKPVVIAGYCYDGRRSGIIVLREKP